MAPFKRASIYEPVCGSCLVMTKAKSPEIKVTRAEYLQDPLHYAIQANNRRRGC